MWTKILARVWGEATGWAFLAYGGSGHPWKQKAYKYPDQLQALVEDAKEYNTFTNIYFCPHLFRSSSSKRKENAAPVKALWLDKDAGPVEDITPKPTICWSTSEGKHHALWLLEEYIDPEEAEIIVRYLTYSISGADRGCWNLGRVIRFPGSTNYKYHPPVSGELLWGNGPVYTKADLEPPADKSIIDLTGHVDIPKLPPNIPTFKEAVIGYGNRISSPAWKLLQEVPDKTDWSANLWKLERMLLEAGVPIEAAFAIVRGSPWNKYSRDGRPDEHLWSEVYKASLEKGPYREDPVDLPWVSLAELMLYSKQPEWLVRGIWMQETVGWIAGVGKSFKTILSTDLAVSVASGTPFLGKYSVEAPGPVLMVQEEDPVRRVAHRIQAISHQKGISNLTLSDDKRALVLEVGQMKVPLYISIGGGLLFRDESKMESLERAIDQHRPKLVILDPMFMIAAGIDEYKAGEIGELLNRVKYWRNSFDCAVAIVHHYRKASGTAIERLYGSQALYSWSENNLFISRAETGDSVLIDRDIKDARRDDRKIAVTFDDIDTTYTFTVNDYEPSAPLTKGAMVRITAFLKGATPKDKLTRKTISEATGVSAKTVGVKLDILEEQGHITSGYGGVGGERVITVLDSLWNVADEEVENLVLTL